MPNKLLLQTLGVSYHTDTRGVEGLMYTPAALAAEEPTPPATAKITHLEPIQNAIDQLRRRIHALVELAAFGQPRGGVAIENEAADLAGIVLPDKGFFHVIKPGVHPRFDIVSDVAALVPWEAMEEWYYVCTTPGCKPDPVGPHRRSAPGAMHCQQCGKPMPEQGGKLALTRHLTHLVRCEAGGAAEGTDFLLIEDPTGDLCASDKTGAAAEHLLKLEELLEQHGYDVNVLQGKNANRSSVAKALKNPALAGVYYFGHGFFPRRGSEGCLILADGPLYASELSVSPSLRFAWINACYGADEGRDWTLERRVRSIGQALAGGPSRCVVAPLWPVVNGQAARAALDFFQKALAGQSIGEALAEVRSASYRRYEEDMPDISWMAYRFYGDPNRALPPPRPKPAVSLGPLPAVVSRLFVDDQFDAEAFAFDIEGVLFRAAKRRNRYGRSKGTPADLLAGMVRVGSLSRYAFQQYGADPDDLYRLILEEGDEKPLAAPADDDGSAAWETGGPTSLDPAVIHIQQLVERMMLRHRNEFDDDLLEVFRRAEENAQRRAAGRTDPRIAEADLLEALVSGDKWLAQVRTELPEPAWLENWLGEREAKGVVDENGRLLLEGLSSAARQIIETAHVLAQQRGVSPIPNRLVLAALLEPADGYAANVCRRHATDPAALSSLLLTITKSHSPETFDLTPDSCRQVVLPMLEQARGIQTRNKLAEMTDAALFKAYCRIAPPAIRQILMALKPPLRADLDRLAGEPLDLPPLPAPPTESPSSHRKRIEAPPVPPPESSSSGSQKLPLDDRASRILDAAANWAVAQGWTEVRSPHLFAALLAPDMPLAERLMRRGVSPTVVIQAMLHLVPSRARPEEQNVSVEPGKRVRQLLVRARQIASQDRRSVVGERDLRRAFLTDMEGVVAQKLRRLDLEWLLEETGDAPPEPLPASGMIEAWATNLTARAKNDAGPRPVGRNVEINALLLAIEAKGKPRPLLAGPAGVGKAAVVEGLAQWMADGLCPENLRRLDVVEVSGRALLAGTRFSEELARRLDTLLSQAPGRWLVFLRDAAPLLLPDGEGFRRPALDRLAERLQNPKLLLVLSMTPEEHEAAMAAEPRVCDWFQSLTIPAPTPERALEMLAAHQPFLEKQHRLMIETEALAAAVDVAMKAGRALPGGALASLRRAIASAPASDSLRVIRRQDIG